MKGPSITPRPPQGQPVVAVLAHVPAAFRLAARGADVVFTTPTDADSARSIVDDGPRPRGDVGAATDRPCRIFADLVVFLDEDAPSRPRAARSGSTSSSAGPSAPTP